MRFLTKFLILIFLQAFLLTGFLAANSFPSVKANEEGNENHSKIAEQNAANANRKGFFNIPLSKDGPVLDFVINPEKVSVYTAGQSPQLLQTLPKSELPYGPGYLPDVDETALVEITDMNFDGYQDVKILSSMGNINAYYDCWLWNQEKKLFVLNEELSALASPSFDAETKRITSFTHISVADNLKGVYIFQNGKLKPLMITEQTYDSDKKLFIIEVSRADENGVMQLVFEETLTPEEMEGRLNYSENGLFPNARFYRSDKGFSLLLPEGVTFQETTEEVNIKSENWFVIVTQAKDAVNNLDNEAVQAELEAKALAQTPLIRGEIEWAYGTDTTHVNFYKFYRRPFTGTLDGLTVEMGELYYANINGKHFRIVSAKLPGIGDSVILLTKMLYTFTAE